MNSHLKIRKTLSLLAMASVLTLLSACSANSNSVRSRTAMLLPDGKQNRYLTSGSIILSRQLPKENAPVLAKAELKERAMAPIIGYVPPAKSFLPAVNETWLQVDRATGQLTVFRGKEKVKSVKINGYVGLPVGSYIVEAKQDQPVWIAPDSYFTKRGLPLPQTAEQRRLRGALGSQALIASNNFAIHSAPFWTEEVGGLRVAATEMQGIYSILSVGSAVVVR